MGGGFKVKASFKINSVKKKINKLKKRETLLRHSIGMYV